ncbi:mobile mystery protein B (plasmid) [Phaeobacter inhibens]|uniref:Mobile mystery protein B n=2 Tax=Phaeobacter inhibens TaxID=221822 RepID=A0ABN5GMB6_9RHOB|nr:mobile mystery protein B [Phaeobacter inhibens]AUQ97380.1 mobile mystery protein B [Phaeobacter inhibens]
MDDFVNEVNRIWETTDPIGLATYVLWKLNFIHPFINGNGRTARAACYFVLCVANGGALPGDEILPTLLKKNRHDLVRCLQAADASLATGKLDLNDLHSLISTLLKEQIDNATPTHT